jgi:hypothetical protein
MVGSAAPRMLGITAPYIQSWNAWYAWFDNRPENLGPWMQKVDEACARVGRDPREIERTCAVYVGHYADAGIGHVQLVLDPITAEAIEEFAPVLEILDRS